MDVGPRATTAIPPIELREVGDADWDRILDGAAGATPFHEAAFLRVAAAQSHRAVRLIAVTVDGVDVGGLPQIVRRLGPVALVNTQHGLFGTLGPVLPSAWQPETLVSAGRLAGRRVGLERYDSPVNLTGQLGPEWGVRREEEFVLSLTGRSEADIRAGMTVNTRRLIRRCSRQTVPGPATERELADVLPRWLEFTFRGSGGRPAFGAERLVAMVRAISRRHPLFTGALRFADGSPACLYIVCARQQRAFGWQLASDPAHRSLGAGFGGYAAMITWALERGCTTIEFGGAPTPGIGRAKLSLGVQPRALFRYERGWGVAYLSRAALVGAKSYVLRNIDAARRRSAQDPSAAPAKPAAPPLPDPGAGPQPGSS